MKFGTDKLFIVMGEDFVEQLDTWKTLAIRDGIKARIKMLITKDINTLKELKL